MNKNQSVMRVEQEETSRKSSKPKQNKHINRKEKGQGKETERHQKVLLLILDGFGIENKSDLALNIYETPRVNINLSEADDLNTEDEKSEHTNAIMAANTFWMNHLANKYQSFLLHASSTHVGLLEKQIGNSEVGHLTIGAGRVVQQPITRISYDSLLSVLNHLILKDDKTKEFYIPKNRVHIIGMFSDTGVHSHINHIKDLEHIFTRQGIEVSIHAISDGVDTTVKFSEFLDDLEDPVIKRISSISGRIYAMDRAGNQKLTRKYFDCITSHKNNLKSCIPLQIKDLVAENYTKNKTDEYFEPVLFRKQGRVKEGDMVIFANFRSDRMKQIYKMFTAFPCKTITMTDFGVPSKRNLILFENTILKNTLGEVIDRACIEQIRLAEKEKKAHVTYFMNGLRFEKFNTEKHIFFDSSKFINNKKLEDRKVEMSIFELLDHLTLLISEGGERMKTEGNHETADKRRLLICNLANADIFGHIGSFRKTKRAIDLLDTCVGLIYQNIKKYKYKLLITSDHGNAECMLMEGRINKKHTLNPVPLIIVDTENHDTNNKHGEVILKEGYSIKDIAPTILDIFDISKPIEMTGESLLNK